MKKGFYPRLAWDAIRKNRRMYIPYILTGSVMVMMFYILMSLIESPDLQNIHGGSILLDVLPLGCVVIGFFSFLFLFYTNSFLIKQRYREFGLYSILGMDKKNISCLMLWENIYTAFISILTGLVCGVAFSKAAELLLLNILGAEISFALHIGVSSLILTAIVYIGIDVVLLLNSLIKVYVSKPLELMQSSRMGEKKLKCNWLFAILGVALLGYAYYMAVSIEEPTTAFLLFFVAVVMVIIGTYLVFISGSVALCKILQKNKTYYYKPNHFVSVSSMAYRMKRNGAGLASICILLTMVLVMLSSTTTMYFGEADSLLNRYPSGVNITVTFQSIEGIGDDVLTDLRGKIRPYAPEGTDLSGVRYAMAAGEFLDDGIILEYTNVDYVDYDKVGYLYIVSIDDYNRMMQEEKTLADGECLIYSDRLETDWKEFSMEFGDSYTVKERLTEFREDGAALAMTMPSVYLVVNDVYAFVEPVMDRENSFGYPMVEYMWLCGIDYEDPEAEVQAKENIFEAIKFYGDNETDIRSLTLESREEEKDVFFEMYGSLFFLGIMLSVVFLMAAVLIIYYKQISEGYEDQGRFEIMQKVGMTEKDIRRTINSQMLTVFFLPLVLAGVHLAFAFPFVLKILTMFAFDDTMLNVCVTLISFLVFGVLYAIVYKITSHSYYSIVCGGKD